MDKYNQIKIEKNKKMSKHPNYQTIDNKNNELKVVGSNGKNNQNVSKTPDRLWFMLNGKKEQKDQFLKIEAITEENSTIDNESPFSTDV